MILSDGDILRQLMDNRENTLSISPYYEEMIQPCSVDLHVDSVFKSLDGETYDLDEMKYIELAPHEFLLGSTFEYVRMPTYLCGELTGRSSVARLGVSLHQTAGFIDAGFEGNITLELYNASDDPFYIWERDVLCQLILFRLTNPCVRPYGSDGLGSKYQGSNGIVESKLR